MKTIKIGRVSGAQGLRGEIKIFHDSGEQEALERLTSLFLFDGNEYKNYRIQKQRMQKRTPIFKLESVDDRDMAESLIGLGVFVDETESRQGGDDVWLASDLTGLEVRIFEEDMAIPFRVKSIISNPAQDILEIETDKGIRMLPFIDIFIKEVDMEAKLITILPPEGWID